MLNFPDISERILNYLNARNINARRHFLRNERKCVGKSIISAQTLQKNKNQNIDADKNIIYERRDRSVGIVVTDWKHFFRKPSLFENQPKISLTGNDKFGNFSDFTTSSGLNIFTN